MKPSFPGFPPAAFQFLRSLRRNNRRDWFQPRKEIYETQVRAPMAELVTAVNAELARWAPDYIHEPERAIYRVYRDTRFSSDKTPYKTHIAAVFPKRGMDKHGAGGLYFSVSPEEVEVAGGVYMPPAENLLAIRSHLVENYGEFRRILRSKKLLALMGELQGEQLSRVPKGFAADHPAADLIRYKQWLFYVLLDPAIALTPRLFDEIISRFRVLLPVVEFLNRPLKRPKTILPPEELLA
jgi:uncharacterized protein (TIGR02453 family)